MAAQLAANERHAHIHTARLGGKELAVLGGANDVLGVSIRQFSTTLTATAAASTL
jgi:hypothetical protein